METINATREQAVNIALSMYVGRQCSVCGIVWDTLDKLKEADPVCSGKDPMTFACGKCFKK